MDKLDDMTREELIAYAQQLEERLAEEGIGVDRWRPETFKVSFPNDQIASISVVTSPPSTRWGITIRTENGEVEQLSASMGQVIKLPMNCTILDEGFIEMPKAPLEGMIKISLLD